MSEVVLGVTGRNCDVEVRVAMFVRCQVVFKVAGKVMFYGR